MRLPLTLRGERFKHKTRLDEYVVEGIYPLHGSNLDAIVDMMVIHMQEQDGEITVVPHWDISSGISQFFGQWRLQKEEGVVLKEGDRIVLYTSVTNGSRWGREINEFIDGRFDYAEKTPPVGAVTDEIRTVYGASDPKLQLPNHMDLVEYLCLLTSELKKHNLFSHDMDLARKALFEGLSKYAGYVAFNDRSLGSLVNKVVDRKAATGLVEETVRKTPDVDFRAAGIHESHNVRSSDSSLYDFVCVTCNHTDITGNGWGKLGDPCPGPQR